MFDCDRLSQSNPYKTLWFLTSQQITLVSNGGPLGAPAERHSEHAIFGSYKLWIEVSACASSLGSALRGSWGPMEYVQNAGQHLAKIANNG